MTDFRPPLRTEQFPFPLLSWFFDAYLNQDWDYFYATDIEALDDFRASAADVEQCNAELVSEIGRALAIPEVTLLPLVEQICDYNFAYFGDDAHTWLEKLRAHLVAAMAEQPRASDPPPTDRSEDDHDH